jgi:replicative DNA helicase
MFFRRRSRRKIGRNCVTTTRGEDDAPALEVVIQVMDRIALRAEVKHPITGVCTGFYELDELTGGLQPEQFIVLAARPSMGKTSLALNICEHVAVELRLGVLLVSLERGRHEVMERLLSSRSKVDRAKLHTGRRFGTREMTLLGKGYDDVRESPLYIDGAAGRSMLQIAAKARRLRVDKHIELVVIDYIQLIDTENAGTLESRREQIAGVSRGLKMLARELQVPVVAVSQLDPAIEDWEDPRPCMADLREWSAIEQHADLMLLLHRPEYYDLNDRPGIAELHVAKNRSGATGSIILTFLANFTRFECLGQVGEPIDAGTF